MLKKLTLIAMVVLFSAASVAEEQTMYNKLDTNNDGAISPIEAVAMPNLNDKWVELDTNADGQLDQAEFAKFEEISE